MPTLTRKIKYGDFMSKRICFICDYVNSKHYEFNDLINCKYYDLINAENETTFTIKINDKVFFSTFGFNILEFLLCIAQWEINKGDMIYNCIDTNDNPLISFIEEDGFYRIHSAWQEFECKEKFDFSELISVKEIL